MHTRAHKDKDDCVLLEISEQELQLYSHQIYLIHQTLNFLKVELMHKAAQDGFTA